MDFKELSKAIEAIYELPLDSNKWGDVQSSLASFSGTIANHILILDKNLTPISNSMYSKWGGDVTQQACQEYTDWYYQFDNGKTIEYSSQYQGKALTNEDITSDKERKTCPLYNDFNRQFQCENQLILGANSGDYFASIIATRPKKDGWFTEHETLAFETLSRNIIQSIRLSNHLQSLFGHDLALQRVLHDEQNATIIVDRNLTILWQSKASEKLLSQKGDLYQQQGKLQVQQLGLKAKLQKLINIATENNLKGSEQCSTLSIRQNNIPLPLAIFSTKQKTIFATDQEQVAALVIRIPKKFTADDCYTLTLLYNLTPAEAKLAIAVANGESLKLYASLNNKSIHTVRSTLKEITAKTATHSQAELVSVIARQL